MTESGRLLAIHVHNKRLAEEKLQKLPELEKQAVKEIARKIQEVRFEYDRKIEEVIANGSPSSKSENMEDALEYLFEEEDLKTDALREKMAELKNMYVAEKVRLEQLIKDEESDIRTLNEMGKR